jgi:hypothetical protein
MREYGQLPTFLVTIVTCYAERCEHEMDG